MRFSDGIEFELGFSIIYPENGRENVLSEVNLSGLENLQECQIEVRHPQREVRILDLPARSERADLPIMRATETP